MVAAAPLGFGVSRRLHIMTTMVVSRIIVRNESPPVSSPKGKVSSLGLLGTVWKERMLTENTNRQKYEKEILTCKLKPEKTVDIRGATTQIWVVPLIG